MTTSRVNIVSVKPVVLVPPSWKTPIAPNAASSCLSASSAPKLKTSERNGSVPGCQMRVILTRLPPLRKNVVLSTLPIDYASLPPDLRASVWRLETQYIHVQVSPVEMVPVGCISGKCKTPHSRVCSCYLLFQTLSPF